MKRLTKEHHKAASRTYKDFLKSQMDILNMVDEPTEENFQWSFAIAIRAGLPRNYTGKELGISQSTIGRWMRGQNLPPNPKVRKTYMDELKLCFNSFISDSKVYQDPLEMNLN